MIVRRASRLWGATRLRRAIASALLGLAVSAFAARAETESLEYQVKASYLFNFLQFIKWPDDAFADGDKFNLCVVNAERFGPTLGLIAGERVRERVIVIHRLDAPAQARQAKCQLLFIAAVPGVPPMDVQPRRGLLTVGETRGSLEHGAVINLVETGGRVRFEINRDAALAAGLVISSRLLALAVN